MFLEFDFVGGPCYKKYPNFDFWLSPLGTPGNPWGPQGVSDQKVAWNRKRLAPYFRRVPFLNYMENPKFLRRPPGQPRLPAPFSRAVGHKS